MAPSYHPADDSVCKYLSRFVSIFHRIIMCQILMDYIVPFSIITYHFSGKISGHTGPSGRASTHPLSRIVRCLSAVASSTEFERHSPFESLRQRLVRKRSAMDSSPHERRVWQHVVAEKRQIRSEAIASLASGPITANTKHEEAHNINVEATGMTKGDEIVNLLARRGSSCESLIRSFIKRLVKPGNFDNSPVQNGRVPLLTSRTEHVKYIIRSVQNKNTVWLHIDQL